MSETAQENIIVLKFGSSVLRADADLPNAVHELYRWYRGAYRVVAVVSAIGDATDRLLERARAISASTDDYATAELLATGERAAAALLGISLARAGVPVRVLNPREVGLTVDGPPLDSDLVSVDLGRLKQMLNATPVLVVPGFFGTDDGGRTHCLGRGGSDLTAVFLAHALYARCRLIKDVDGVYDVDPAGAERAVPKRYESLTYADALRVAGPLIQAKAVQYLRDHRTTAEVAALARGHESLVYSGHTRFARARLASPPFRVLLLGRGTVGGGVWERLRADPDRFEVVGCLVRERTKHVEQGVPAALVHSTASEVLSLIETHSCDAVIDALPGVEPSKSLVEPALRAGIPIVSANKALIAEYGGALAGLAAKTRASLRYAAAVGGACPMLETVDRLAGEAQIATVSAVLNGTCNFILDVCATGATLGTAVAEARRAGFAESDASEDLSGLDAERKLRILCRHAFGAEPERVDVEPFNESVAQRARDLAALGSKLKQVGRAHADGGVVYARVAFEPFDEGSPFGRLVREWNGVELTDSAGQVCRVAGLGAGRWPTTEAVMADLFDLYRARAAPG